MVVSNVLDGFSGVWTPAAVGRLVSTSVRCSVSTGSGPFGRALAVVPVDAVEVGAAAGDESPAPLVEQPVSANASKVATASATRVCLLVFVPMLSAIAPTPQSSRRNRTPRNVID